MSDGPTKGIGPSLGNAYGGDIASSPADYERLLDDALGLGISLVPSGDTSATTVSDGDTFDREGSPLATVESGFKKLQSLASRKKEAFVRGMAEKFDEVHRYVNDVSSVSERLSRLKRVLSGIEELAKKNGLRGLLDEELSIKEIYENLDSALKVLTDSGSNDAKKLGAISYIALVEEGSAELEYWLEGYRQYVLSSKYLKGSRFSSEFSRRTSEIITLFAERYLYFTPSVVTVSDYFTRSGEYEERLRFAVGLDLVFEIAERAMGACGRFEEEVELLSLNVIPSEFRVILNRLLSEVDRGISAGEIDYAEMEKVFRRIEEVSIWLIAFLKIADNYAKYVSNDPSLKHTAVDKAFRFDIERLFRAVVERPCTDGDISGEAGLLLEKIQRRFRILFARKELVDSISGLPLQKMREEALRLGLELAGRNAGDEAAERRLDALQRILGSVTEIKKACAEVTPDRIEAEPDFFKLYDEYATALYDLWQSELYTVSGEHAFPNLPAAYDVMSKIGCMPDKEAMEDIAKINNYLMSGEGPGVDIALLGRNISFLLEGVMGAAGGAARLVDDTILSGIERIYDPSLKSMAGLALLSRLFGSPERLPYSVRTHPDVLAGYLVHDANLAAALKEVGELYKYGDIDIKTLGGRLNGITDQMIRGNLAATVERFRKISALLPLKKLSSIYVEDIAGRGDHSLDEAFNIVLGFGKRLEEFDASMRSSNLDTEAFLKLVSDYGEALSGIWKEGFRRQMNAQSVLRISEDTRVLCLDKDLMDELGLLLFGRLDEDDDRKLELMTKFAELPLRPDFLYVAFYLILYQDENLARISAIVDPSERTITGLAYLEGLISTERAEIKGIIKDPGLLLAVLERFEIAEIGSLEGWDAASFKSAFETVGRDFRLGKIKESEIKKRLLAILAGEARVIGEKMGGSVYDELLRNISYVNRELYHGFYLRERRAAALTGLKFPRLVELSPDVGRLSHDSGLMPTEGGARRRHIFHEVQGGKNWVVYEDEERYQTLLETKKILDEQFRRMEEEHERLSGIFGEEYGNGAPGAREILTLEEYVKGKLYRHYLDHADENLLPPEAYEIFDNGAFLADESVMLGDLQKSWEEYNAVETGEWETVVDRVFSHWRPEVGDIVEGFSSVHSFEELIEGRDKLADVLKRESNSPSDLATIAAYEKRLLEAGRFHEYLNKLAESEGGQLAVFRKGSSVSQALAASKNFLRREADRSSGISDIIAATERLERRMASVNEMVDTGNLFSTIGVAGAQLAILILSAGAGASARTALSRAMTESFAKKLGIRAVEMSVAELGWVERGALGFNTFVADATVFDAAMHALNTPIFLEYPESFGKYAEGLVHTYAVFGSLKSTHLVGRLTGFRPAVGAKLLNQMHTELATEGWSRLLAPGSELAVFEERAILASMNKMSASHHALSLLSSFGVLHGVGDNLLPAAGVGEHVDQTASSYLYSLLTLAVLHAYNMGNDHMGSDEGAEVKSEVRYRDAFSLSRALLEFEVINRGGEIRLIEDGFEVFDKGGGLLQRHLLAPGTHGGEKTLSELKNIFFGRGRKAEKTGGSESDPDYGPLLTKHGNSHREDVRPKITGKELELDDIREGQLKLAERQGKEREIKRIKGLIARRRGILDAALKKGFRLEEEANGVELYSYDLSDEEMIHLPYELKTKCGLDLEASPATAIEFSPERKIYLVKREYLQVVRDFLSLSGDKPAKGTRENRDDDAVYRLTADGTLKRVNKREPPKQVNNPVPQKKDAAYEPEAKFSVKEGGGDDILPESVEGRTAEATSLATAISRVYDSTSNEPIKTGLVGLETSGLKRLEGVLRVMVESAKENGKKRLDVSIAGAGPIDPHAIKILRQLEAEIGDIEIFIWFREMKREIDAFKTFNEDIEETERFRYQAVSSRKGGGDETEYDLILWPFPSPDTSPSTIVRNLREGGFLILGTDLPPFHSDPIIDKGGYEVVFRKKTTKGDYLLPGEHLGEEQFPSEVVILRKVSGSGDQSTPARFRDVEGVSLEEITPVLEELRQKMVELPHGKELLETIVDRLVAGGLSRGDIKALEIGPGTKLDILDQLLGLGLQVTATELPADDLHSSISRLEKYNLKLGERPEEQKRFRYFDSIDFSLDHKNGDHSYDIVVSNLPLPKYTPDDATDILDIMDEAIKPGGFFIIQTDNPGYYLYALNESGGRYRLVHLNRSIIFPTLYLYDLKRTWTAVYQRVDAEDALPTKASLKFPEAKFSVKGKSSGGEKPTPSKDKYIKTLSKVVEAEARKFPETKEGLNKYEQGVVIRATALEMLRNGEIVSKRTVHNRLVEKGYEGIKHYTVSNVIHNAQKANWLPRLTTEERSKLESEVLSNSGLDGATRVRAVIAEMMAEGRIRITMGDILAYLRQKGTKDIPLHIVRDTFYKEQPKNPKLVALTPREYYEKLKALDVNERQRTTTVYRYILEKMLPADGKRISLSPLKVYLKMQADGYTKIKWKDVQDTCRQMCRIGIIDPPTREDTTKARHVHNLQQEKGTTVAYYYIKEKILSGAKEPVPISVTGTWKRMLVDDIPVTKKQVKRALATLREEGLVRNFDVGGERGENWCNLTSSPPPVSMKMRGKTPSPIDLLEQAESAISEKDFPRAIVLLKQAEVAFFVKKRFNVAADIQMRSGKVYEKMGNRVEARTSYLVAAEDFERAKNKAGIERALKAAENINLQTKAAIYLPKAGYSVGKGNGRGNGNDARTDIQTEISPGDLAELQQRHTPLGRALQLLEKYSPEVIDKYPDARLILARRRIDQKKSNEAFQIIRSVMDDFPDDDRLLNKALHVRAYLYFRTTRLELAEADLRRLIEEGKVEARDVYDFLVLILTRRSGLSRKVGRLEAALKIENEALEIIRSVTAPDGLSPNDPVLIARKAKIELARGEYKKAGETMIGPLEENTGFVEFPFIMARALVGQGRPFKEIIPYFDRLFSTMGRLDGNILGLLRIGLWKIGAPAEIVEKFDLLSKEQAAYSTEDFKMKIYELVGLALIEAVRSGGANKREGALPQKASLNFPEAKFSVRGKGAGGKGQKGGNGRAGLLTFGELTDLLRQVQTGDKRSKERARRDLIDRNMGLVKAFANKYWRGDKQLFDEFVSVGIFGLSRAIDKADPETPWTFSTYAGKAIRNEIIKYMKLIESREINSLDRPSKFHEGESVIDSVAGGNGNDSLEEDVVKRISVEKMMEVIDSLRPTLDELDTAVLDRVLLSYDPEEQAGLAAEFGVTRAAVSLRGQKLKMRIAEAYKLYEGGNELRKKGRSLIYQRDEMERTRLMRDEFSRVVNSWKEGGGRLVREFSGPEEILESVLKGEPIIVTGENPSFEGILGEGDLSYLNGGLAHYTGRERQIRLIRDIAIVTGMFDMSTTAFLAKWSSRGERDNLRKLTGWKTLYSPWYKLIYVHNNVDWSDYRGEDGGRRLASKYFRGNLYTASQAALTFLSPEEYASLGWYSKKPADRPSVLKFPEPPAAKFEVRGKRPGGTLEDNFIVPEAYSFAGFEVQSDKIKLFDGLSAASHQAITSPQMIKAESEVKFSVPIVLNGRSYQLLATQHLDGVNKWTLYVVDPDFDPQTNKNIKYLATYTFALDRENRVYTSHDIRTDVRHRRKGFIKLLRDFTWRATGGADTILVSDIQMTNPNHEALVDFVLSDSEPETFGTTEVGEEYRRYWEEVSGRRVKDVRLSIPVGMVQMLERLPDIDSVRSEFSEVYSFDIIINLSDRNVPKGSGDALPEKASIYPPEAKFSVRGEKDKSKRSREEYIDALSEVVEAEAHRFPKNMEGPIVEKGVVIRATVLEMLKEEGTIVSKRTIHDRLLEKGYDDIEFSTVSHVVHKAQKRGWMPRVSREERGKVESEALKALGRDGASRVRAVINEMIAQGNTGITVDDVLSKKEVEGISPNVVRNVFYRMKPGNSALVSLTPRQRYEKMKAANKDGGEKAATIYYYILEDMLPADGKRISISPLEVYLKMQADGYTGITRDNVMDTCRRLQKRGIIAPPTPEDILRARHMRKSPKKKMTPSDLLERAERAIDKKDFPRAIILLEQAEIAFFIKGRFADAANVQMRIGDVYAEMGDRVGAWRSYSVAAEKFERAENEAGVERALKAVAENRSDKPVTPVLPKKDAVYPPKADYFAGTGNGRGDGNVRTGLLTFDELTDFLKQVQTGDKRTSDKARRILIDRNIGLVKKIARRFAGSDDYRFDELCSAGIVGLSKAIDKADPERPEAFSTYASKVIYRRIRRYIRDIESPEILILNGPNKIREGEEVIDSVASGDKPVEDVVTHRLSVPDLMAAIDGLRPGLDPLDTAILDRMLLSDDPEETQEKVAGEFGVSRITVGSRRDGLIERIKINYKSFTKGKATQTKDRMGVPKQSRIKHVKKMKDEFGLVVNLWKGGGGRLVREFSGPEEILESVLKGEPVIVTGENSSFEGVLGGVDLSYLNNGLVHYMGREGQIRLVRDIAIVTGRFNTTVRPFWNKLTRNDRESLKAQTKWMPFPVSWHKLIYLSGDVDWNNYRGRGGREAFALKYFGGDVTVAGQVALTLLGTEGVSSLGWRTRKPLTDAIYPPKAEFRTRDDDNGDKGPRPPGDKVIDLKTAMKRCSGNGEKGGDGGSGGDDGDVKTKDVIPFPRPPKFAVDTTGGKEITDPETGRMMVDEFRLIKTEFKKNGGRLVDDLSTPISIIETMLQGGQVVISGSKYLFNDTLLGDIDLNRLNEGLRHYMGGMGLVTLIRDVAIVTGQFNLNAQTFLDGLEREKKADLKKDMGWGTIHAPWHRHIYVMKDAKWEECEGIEGYERFASRYFNGNMPIAYVAARTILDEPNFYKLNWTYSNRKLPAEKVPRLSLKPAGERALSGQQPASSKPKIPKVKQEKSVGHRKVADDGNGTKSHHEIPGTYSEYLKKVDSIPVLTREEEEDLFRRYRESGDMVAFRRIVEANQRIVLKAAIHYVKGSPHKIMDLIQAGNIGLIKGIKRFDPTRSDRFYSTGYASIKAEIIYYLEKNYNPVINLLTDHWQWSLYRNYDKAIAELNAKGQTPDDALVAEIVGLTPERVRIFRERMDTRIISLDGPASSNSDGGNGSAMHEIVPGGSGSTEGAFAEREGQSLAEKLAAEFMNTLDEREKNIFLNRLLVDKEERQGLRELGAELNISAERVRQLEDKIKERFKKYVLEKGISPDDVFE